MLYSDSCSPESGMLSSVPGTLSSLIDLINWLVDTIIHFAFPVLVICGFNVESCEQCVLGAIGTCAAWNCQLLVVRNVAQSIRFTIVVRSEFL